jgi:ketol-acid reductoisomerase
MRLYGPKDVDKTALRRARIAVLGYGSQGRAHALNLKDSGFDVVVGVRAAASWKKAKKDGLAVAEPAAAVKGAKLVAMLTPDLTQKAVRPSHREEPSRRAPRCCSRTASISTSSRSSRARTSTWC